MNRPVISQLLGEGVPVPLCVTPAWRKDRKRGERRNKRKKVIEGLWAQSHDLRFDCDARVEIWITQDDLEDDTQVQQILAHTDISVEEKKSLVLKRASAMAYEQVSAVKGVEITADPRVDTINVDRIDWGGLLEPEPEESKQDLRGPIPGPNEPGVPDGWGRLPTNRPWEPGHSFDHLPDV